MVSTEGIQAEGASDMVWQYYGLPRGLSASNSVICPCVLAALLLLPFHYPDLNRWVRDLASHLSYIQLQICYATINYEQSTATSAVYESTAPLRNPSLSYDHPSPDISFGYPHGLDIESPAGRSSGRLVPCLRNGSVHRVVDPV